MKKSISLIAALVIFAAVLSACQGTNTPDDDSKTNSLIAANSSNLSYTSNMTDSSQNSTASFDSQSSATSDTSLPPVTIERFTVFDQNDSIDDDAVRINFDNDNITIDGEGAKADGTILTITQAGNYVISGKLTDGQIIVNVTKADKVHLILNGTEVASTTTSPLNIISADKVSLTLVKNTVNKFSDATIYTSDVTTGATACIYSKDDLSINGNGTLIVNGNFNNGIATTNDLKIVSGTITVRARNNAIKGKDSISIKNGTISVTSTDDGIKSDNELETGKGYIYIEGGNISITSNDDALQAFTDVTIKGGTVHVKCGGKPVKCDGTKQITDGCLTTG
ncbi:MAG: carbohydrate-binding domain-containing protein [Clostridia bacterium]